MNNYRIKDLNKIPRGSGKKEGSIGILCGYTNINFYRLLNKFKM
jgi:hypothetical protein